MALMVLAMTILPSTDASAKLLAGSMSSSQLTWSRFFSQSIFMFPLALRAPMLLPAPGLVSMPSAVYYRT
ncbi:MAG: hypothetical protein GKR94_25300 [Gammaproteobacteria bacterium]|nr:hypothetical protein [Gammaproteobacteria bacterium]